MLNMVKTSYDQVNDRYTFFGMFGIYFGGFIRNNILSENKCKKLFTTLTNNVITIDSFFLIELREIILEVIEKSNKYNYSVNVKTLSNLLKELENNTWLGHNGKGDFKLDTKHMEEVLKVRPKEFQEPVYEGYEYKKNVLNNRGMLLDMATGTGKTYTSISIMTGCKVDIQLYIVMNKNIDTVWYNCLALNGDGFFKEDPERSDIYTSDDLYDKIPYKDQKVILVHYEALDKLIDLIKDINNKNIGIVVDEVHNFTSQSNRYDNLLDICNLSKSENIVLMSGTPIKGSSLEFITYLEILNRNFNSKVKKKYKDLYGSPNYILKRCMQIRYQTTSTKIHKEVLQLPDVEYKTIDIKLLNGKIYTLTNVKKLMKQYLENRMAEIEDNIDVYHDQYQTLLDKAMKANPKADWTKYFRDFERIKEFYNKKQLMFNLDLMRDINNFEKINIIDYLTSEEKKTFKECTIILKYPLLKIRGEVLGNVVLRMRISCHREMAGVINYENIINSSLGKTIVVSGYIDVIKEAEDKINKSGFKTVGVYGKETKNIDTLIDKFKKDENISALVGTYPSIGTGHHLVEANIVVLLDLPFRTYLLDQTIARVNRMGQTRQVYAIYTKLDTEDEFNLNSRNIDILKWTRDAIEEITGHPVVGMDFEEGASIDTISIENFNTVNNDCNDLVMHESEALLLEYNENDHKDINMENLRVATESFNAQLKEIDLPFRANAISNEGIIDSFKSIGNYFYRGLEDTVTMFKKMEDTGVRLEKDEIFNKDVKELEAAISKLPHDPAKAGIIYSTIGSVKVPVVLGLKEDIKTVLETIHPVLVHIEENLVNVIEDCTLFINRLMSSDEFRLASRYNDFKVKDIKIWETHRLFDKLIDENGTSDRKAINTLLPNISTLVSTKDLIVKNEKVLDVMLLKEVKTKTVKLSKNANDLFEFISENNDQAINKNMITLLADRLEDTARYVNDASSVIYLYKQTIYTLKEIVRLANDVK